MKRRADSIELTTSSCYYEPVSKLDGVPCDEKKTFAQCNIEDGDTFQWFLRDEYILITIEDRSKNDYLIKVVKASTTIANLIETIWSAVCAEWLTLHYGDTQLDTRSKKTLADYNIKNNSNLRLGLVHCLDISVGVLVYAKLEQVLFEPGEAIEALETRIAMKYPDFRECANACAMKKLILRGVIQDSPSTKVHVYLYLRQRKIEIFSAELMDGTLECSIPIWDIPRGHTVDDIRQFSNRRWTRRSKYRKVTLFDYIWTMNFLPQIEGDTLTPGRHNAMQLFFFPLNVKPVLSSRVELSHRTEKLLTAVCEQEGLKAEQYTLLHPDMNDHLNLHNNSSWLTYRHVLKKKSLVLLTKRARYEVVDKLDVKVQCLSPKEFIVPITVGADCTVYELKKEIEDGTIMAPVLTQKLIFCGKPLENDECTLAEVGIVNGSMVVLQLIL